LFLPLSKSLQSQDIDLLQARDDIFGITDILQLRRQEADERFQRHFQSVEALCQQHDINIMTTFKHRDELVYRHIARIIAFLLQQRRNHSDS